MSSRALRKAQKELEEQRRLEQLAQQDEEDESEEDVAPVTRSKPSLFAMLGDTAEDEEHDDEDEEDHQSGDGVLEEPQVVAPAPKPSKKSKKKKKKGKGKAKPEAEEKTRSSKPESNMDEIDLALAALKITKSANEQGTDGAVSSISDELKHLYAVLAIDSQHLQAANEMRKLFGRAALQNIEDEQARARQRGRGQQQVIGAGGKGLASLGLRRNIFIQGKEDWPKATSGGLGMEVVEKRTDGTVEYRFVHNTTYQAVQRQFQTCVASMDPDRMVQLLQFNPYHVSTLLQVSEILKQQRDNAQAGDLLERALFTFGRAVHSTFSNNLSQGKARLDFRRPENREFWLAGWRYIGTLGIRATWRTAFEWAKLLLSLAPEEDPYCIRLFIDQLALRGREPQNLVDLVESDHLQRAWKVPPNLAFSVAIAYDRLKNPEKARSSLRLAMKEYPWIAARLCKELDISPIPKSVWGKEPNGDHQELLCQLYVPKAKDLWNTPEATSLLVEVAYSIEEPLGAGEDPYWLAPIDETNLARHVILTDDTSLMNLLDKKIKNKYTSVSDPLPPATNLTSYGLTSSGVDEDRDRTRLVAELDRLRIYFSRIPLGNIHQGATQEDLVRLLQEAGTTIDEFRLHTERVQVLRMRLEQLGVEVIFQEAEQEREPEQEQDSEDDEDTDSDV